MMGTLLTAARKLLHVRLYCSDHQSHPACFDVPPETRGVNFGIANVFGHAQHGCCIVGDDLSLAYVGQGGTGIVVFRLDDPRVEPASSKKPPWFSLPYMEMTIPSTSMVGPSMIFAGLTTAGSLTLRQ